MWQRNAFFWRKKRKNNFSAFIVFFSFKWNIEIWVLGICDWIFKCLASESFSVREVELVKIKSFFCAVVELHFHPFFSFPIPLKTLCSPAPYFVSKSKHFVQLNAHSQRSNYQVCPKLIISLKNIFNFVK